jgi:lysyl endopeptidase
VAATRVRFSARYVAWALVAPLGGQVALAASDVNVLKIDLAPKIETAIVDPDRFAVAVPHVVTTAEAGAWARTSAVSTWRYTVRIPTAVSMSFHAGLYDLPASATLTVTGTDGQSFGYTADQGGRGQLWSRVHRGDSLSFELSVPRALESRVRFALQGLQAGYRGLGGGTPDHPHYRKLRAATLVGASACSENFACRADASNSKNADATAAIIIGGVAQCTATLVNNLRNDGTPYLLSARHCQDTPSSGVVAYWNAVAACGTALGSIYDTQMPAYLHSTDTVFEQQDVWMMRLSSPVNAPRVYFAGWDATGATFVGGYSPHHALGRSRQYTGWFGQAALVALPAEVIGMGYSFDSWGVVNSVGNIGAGASGGGLFDPDHRLVGVASLAYLLANGEGVCPATPPDVPTSTTATALYNSLAAVWESNADTTSFTNPVTLKSLLDPDNSGARVADGFEMLQNVSFSASSSDKSTGEPLTLTWNAPGASSCTASGGAAGDNWNGSLAASGTRDVVQYAPGQTTYDLSCTDGTRFSARSVRVNWYEGSPQLVFGLSESSGNLGGTISIFWRSNVQPCVAAGGLAGDGWAGNKATTGNQQLALSQVGAFTYSITCGTGTRQLSRSVNVDVFAPYASLEALSNNMRIGSEVQLMQAGRGTQCVRTGGVPGDGWTTTTNNYPFRTTAHTPGTYRFTITCEGGPTPAVASVDLTFTDSAPTATLTPSRPSATVAPSGPVAFTDPAWVITLDWVSNIAPCQLSWDGPGNADGSSTPNMILLGAGSYNAVQDVVGTFVYRITCTQGADTSTATATVDFVPPAPSVKLLLLQGGPVAANEVIANEPFSIGWTSTVSNCVASGGVAGDNWAGPKANSGGVSLTLHEPGTYNYSISCGTAPEVVSDSMNIVIASPRVEFRPHDATGLVGRGYLLQWVSNTGPCTPTGDWANSAQHPAVWGSVIVPSVPGIQTLGIRCGTGAQIAETSTQVTFYAVPTVDIFADAASVPVNQPITLTWNSTGATSCAVQGTGSDDWTGSLPTSGSRIVTRSTPGTVGFYINCDDIIDAVVVEWRSVAPKPSPASSPTLTFNIDHASRVPGEAVTLTWTTTRAAVCHGSGGVNGDGWPGVLPVSGTRTYTITGAGTFTWDLTCDGAPPAASARVSTTYTSPPPPPPPPPPSGGSSSGGASSSGGSKGGGQLDPLLLAFLAVLGLMGAVRVARRGRAAPA